MTKQGLIEFIAEEAEVTKADVTRVLEAARKGIEKALVENGEITFVGFGKFAVKTREAREGINPSTKEKIQIPAKKAVTFKAGAKLKEIVQ